MSYSDYTVRYEVLDTGAIREKSFKTDAARERWITKQIDAGNIKPLAYSDPQ